MSYCLFFGMFFFVTLLKAQVPKTPFVSLRWLHNYEEEKNQKIEFENKKKEEREVFLKRESERKKRIANVRLSQERPLVSQEPTFSPLEYQRGVSDDIIEHVYQLPRRFVLNGILYSDEDSTAVIDDRVYREGTLISDGVTLKKVFARRIILEYKGVEFELSSATNEVKMLGKET